MWWSTFLAILHVLTLLKRQMPLLPPGSDASDLRIIFKNKKTVNYIIENAIISICLYQKHETTDCEMALSWLRWIIIAIEELRKANNLLFWFIVIGKHLWIKLLAKFKVRGFIETQTEENIDKEQGHQKSVFTSKVDPLEA